MGNPLTSHLSMCYDKKKKKNQGTCSNSHRIDCLGGMMAVTFETETFLENLKMSAVWTLGHSVKQEETEG